MVTCLRPRSAAALISVAAVLAFAVTVGAQVPTPADVIGFAPGTDYKLAHYEQIERYFRALDDASDRVLVEQIGESTLGRPLLLAIISTEENLRNRERYREISQRLAQVKDLTDAEARVAWLL